MKADLLTYPLPIEEGSRRFGLKELVESALDSDIEIIGVIGYTDVDDNPDKRFKLFYEDRKNLPQNYEFVAHPWSEGDERVVAFSVIDKKDGRKRTFVYGQNGLVKYKERKVKLLRVGTRYFAKPDISLEDALDEAEKNGAISIVDNFSIPNLYHPEIFKAKKGNELTLPGDFILQRFDASYWDAQILDREEQEGNTTIAADVDLPIIPVSNAHMPYLWRPAKKRLEEIGKAHIKFEDFSWKDGSELIGNLKEIIKWRDFKEHREYSSLRRIFAWKWRMAARKFLKTLCVNSSDYTWKEGDPIVKINEVS